MKILILGHGRHGKDQFAEYLCKHSNLKSISSSLCAAEEIFPALNCALDYKYDSIACAYDDRHNHRELWKELICLYNYADPTALARKVLETSEIYVGMRSYIEYKACLKDGLFDIVVWVDASQRVDYLDSTMKIHYDNGMIKIPNNRSLQELELTAKAFINNIIGNEDD